MSELLIGCDFETTNLTLHPNADLKKQPRAIEFGGALMDMETGQIVEELSILINPECEITPEITKITGITNDDVRDAPTFIEILPQLRHIFSQATTLVAHNLPFDKMILKCELMRANVNDFPWPPREMCTVGSGTGVGTGVGSGVGTGVGSGVGTGVGSGTGVGVGTGVGSGTGTGVGSGEGGGGCGVGIGAGW